MAERRMFAKSIVLSDAFLDMPMSARCLYFTLGMLADDDGFVGSPKSIMRQCGASEDDMNILFAKRYILGFESGVIVIKHWRMNNYLRNDRYNKTTYLEEKDTLTLDEKGSYTEKDKNGCQVVYQMATQDRLGKDSIGKDSIYSEARNDKKPTKHKYGEYKHVLLTEEQHTHLINDFGEDTVNDYIRKVDEYIQLKGKPYKDYNLAIRNWLRNDRQKTIPENRDESLPIYDTSKNPKLDLGRLKEIENRRKEKL